MTDLLNESLALMPGHSRGHWSLDESKTQVFNPYGMGMWVIRVEDYLYKLTGKKWTWKKPILTMEGGKKIQYKWVGRKKRGAISPAIFTSTVEYKPGPDAYDVETAYFDGNNIVASKSHRGVYIEQAVDPAVLFGWVRRKWNRKTGMQAESIEESKAPFADIERGLIDYLKTHKSISVKELAYSFKGGSAKIEKLLSKMVKAGKLKKHKHQTGGAMTPKMSDYVYSLASTHESADSGWARAASVMLKKRRGKSREDLYYRAYLRAVIQGNQAQATHLRKKFAASEKAAQDLIDRGPMLKHEGAPGPFAVSDNPPSIQDMVDTVREQIKNPSWTYPSWALPKVQLDESLPPAQRKALSFIARSDALPMSALRAKGSELKALSDRGLIRWDLGTKGYAITPKGRNALA